jgi:hypothetical protein
MPWEPPAQAFKRGEWQPPAEAFGKPSAAEVGATMRAKYPEAFATPDAPQSWGEVAENVTINDILAGPIMGAYDTAKALVTHPIDTVKGLVTGPRDQAKKAYAAARQGDIPEALSRAANAVPFIGSIGESADINHPGRVIGNTAVAALPATPSGRALAGEARTAVSDAAAPSVVALKGAAKAGGKDIAVGASKIAGGAIVDAAGAPYHVGTLYGIKQGAADIVKGGKAALQGGKDALARFRQLQEQARKPPRAPITAPPSSVPRGTPQPHAAPPPAAPGALPSGRRPGGIQNQKNVPVSAPASVIDPLDAIAAGDPILPTDTIPMVAKKLDFKGKITPSKELEIRVALKAAEQEAAMKSARGAMDSQGATMPPPKPPLPPPGAGMATPTPSETIPASGAPTPDVTPFGQAMQKALDNLRETPAGKRKIDPNMYGSTRPKSELSPWEDQAKGAQRSAPHELKATIAADLAESSGITPEQVAAFTDSQKAAFTEGLKKAHPNKWKTGLDLTNTWEDIADTLKTRQANPIYSRFNRPIQSPHLLAPEQLTTQIERLSKKPNLTIGETNLLRQLRDEVKKRSTK